MPIPTVVLRAPCTDRMDAQVWPRRTPHVGTRHNPEPTGPPTQDRLTLREDGIADPAGGWEWPGAQGKGSKLH